MIIGLEKIIEMHSSDVGAKAYNLALCASICKNLKSIHFPKSIVITKEELYEFYHRKYSYQDRIIEKIKNIFGNTSIIVRSSSNLEDSKFFSGAGQYSTFMNLYNKKEISKAIKLVYQSASSETAKLYNSLYHFEIDEKLGNMCVLIQEMIQCDCSGVLYTSNPIDGSNEILVEYSFDSGDKVASGEIDSNTYTLNSSFHNYPVIENESLQKQMIALKEVATKLINSFDCHLDIEWGIANGKLFLFQARPMFKCSSEAWDTEFIKQSSPIAKTGKIISTGLTVGKINQASIYVRKEKDTNISNIIDCNGSVIFQGGLLSHFSSLAREMSNPCILLKNLNASSKYWVLNGYTGQLISWDDVNDMHKSKYLWEYFYHIGNNLKKEVLRRKNIIKTEINIKFESVLFRYNDKAIENIEHCDDCIKNTFFQSSVTYDLQTKTLINHDIIIRLQTSKDYIRLQIKKCEYPSKTYRKDIEILLYFDTKQHFNDFINNCPLVVTGFQRRKRTSYHFQDYIVNVIEWNGKKSYIGIEVDKPKNIDAICSLLEIKPTELRGVGGKEIFQHLGLKINDL